MTETGANGTLMSNRPAMERFLERMRNSGNVRASCSAAGVPRRTVYNWRARWKTFADEWDEAKEDAVDALDLEAWKRATEGQSDKLLMFLLKAHKPEVYNPVSKSEVELGGTDGGAIRIEVVGGYRTPEPDNPA